MEALPRRIARLPRAPGVYLFKGDDGTVLYVGKAVDLRARVRQYFAGGDGRIMVPWLVGEIADVEVVLTTTEKEALILENTLIKRFHPRYNAQLRDDKNFLHLRLDFSEPWPRLTLRRRIQPDGARYFGPYHSAVRARQTLDAVQRHFPLRRCGDRSLHGRLRPCLLHQLHRCAAPCVGLIGAEAYAEIAEEAALFLAGRSRELIRRLERRMLAHAEAERFEEAARQRDLVRAIEATIERQRVVDQHLGDRDIWGLFRDGERGVAAILPVRGGYLLEPRMHRVEGHAEDDAALLSTLLLQHYDPPEGGDTREHVPPELLIPQIPADADTLAEVLGERRGTRVWLHVPERGDKRVLLELAERNARERFLGATSDEERAAAALAALAEVCRLPAAPRRIECFDNSNLQGSDPVASMVVFVDGRPERAAYRRYRVRTVQGVDDYSSMREILGRRLRRGQVEGTLPDLLVVDGGHGQVSAARAVLAELGLDTLPVIGLVKPRTERAQGRRDALDRIVLPAIREPLRLKANHPALRLLQHLRDESHATAVRYHRKVRTKRTLESALEAIPGVGPARRTALLRHFGSARQVAEASLEELSKAPGLGPAVARRIHAALHPEEPEG